ncbi:MAG TPA: DUF4440 domain-containing protein [Pyrinomonadaceae bacterium]|jgi:ketosteroid isomerase-like protein|nr:DUF4440 domain-containing protein [Pyrinomonadaceae bacterium]
MNRSLLIFLTAALVALLVLSPTAFTQNENLTPALSSLVEAERSFARTAAEKGVRDSFYEYFADDGINFQPHPVNTRESIRKSPAPATRSPVTLHWEPVYADISRAGDLGFTTGPFWTTDRSPEPRPSRHGYYFSIWKKQADGNWKVVIDAGVETPAPEASEPPAFRAARPSQFRQTSAKVNPERERAALMAMEREFLKKSKAVGVMKAFLDFIDDDARLHRNGMFPQTGKEAFNSYFSGKETGLVWEPIKADVARSNDLGYTYGSYEVKGQGAASPLEKGYYVRVWKRNRDGKWKVALDTTNPLPAEKK